MVGGKIMILYLAEKKSLAEAIAEAIDGGEKKENGVIYKGEHVITWLSGHLLTLYDPEDYDINYKNWSIDVLPLYFENWKNKIPEKNKARVKQIQALLNKADMVVNCGDVDEEGQLLVDELLRFCHYTGPCMRLDTANTTVEALRKALRHMKDNKECENAGWSAYARMVADKTFGINLTRFYSSIYHTLLTIGRVQTPTLGMVVNRDMMIESHKKIFYYTLSVICRLEMQEMELKYTPNKNHPDLTDGKFLNPEYLQELGQNLKKLNLQCKVGKEQIREKPPLPFNLNKLNTYCGKKWGYIPAQVMKITQSLRDDYAAITYNRSNCQYLSMDHYLEAPQTLDKVCQNMKLNRKDYDEQIVSDCFNDEKITAHFAIIPTAKEINIEELTQEQRNVYDIICRYYLAQFMPACKKEKTVLTIPLYVGTDREGKLGTSFVRITEPGYRAIFGKEDFEDLEEKGINQTCELKEGIYPSNVISDNLIKRETKPPQHYTQTTLYNDMTRISKYVDDSEIKRLLLEKDKSKEGENGSIGTDATRDQIILKLIKNGYLIEQEKGKNKWLISTDKGRKFYHMLPDSVKKADTTALWWVIQEDIKEGRADQGKLAEKVLETIRQVIHSAEYDASMETIMDKQKQILCKCPSCGSDIYMGKYGPYCQGKCGFSNPYAFGKKLTIEQFVSLCQGRKTKITGIKKKQGGSFSCFAVPKGIKEYQYEKDGVMKTGKQLVLEMAFK